MLRGPLLMLRGFYETWKISYPTVLEAFTGAKDAATHDARLDSWSRRLLEGARVRMTVSGRENVRPGGVYIIMSNHESVFDIPLIFQAVPVRLRMVAKAELFRVPVWGRAMRAAGFIELDRRDLTRAKRGLEHTKTRLAEGISMWIAPEGTRSRTGQMLPFKKGGFHMAVQTGYSILPVGIAGSADILAPDTADVRPGCDVHLTIRPPIAAPTEDSPEAIAKLMDDVRASILAGVEQSRAARARPP